MKYIAYVLIFVLSIALMAMCYFYNENKKNSSGYLGNVKSQIDSADKYRAKSFYLDNLWLGVQKNKNVSLKKGQVIYKLEDSKRIPISLDNLFKNKKTLVIRYTQIGCNACVDSTFKEIKKIKRVTNNYNVIAIVDFSDPEYYLKWRRISDIEYDVYWAKKGDIPYPADNDDKSYLFTVDEKLNLNSFFIPNSLHVGYLTQYLNLL